MNSIEVRIRQKTFRLIFHREGSNLLTLSAPTEALEVMQSEAGYQFTFDEAALNLEISDNEISFKWQGRDISNRIVMDGYWFGMGNLNHQRWPLNKLMIPVSEMMTSDSEESGLSTLVSPTWLTHDGVAILVKSPFSVGLNQPPKYLIKRNANIPGEYIPFDQRPWFDKKGQGDMHLTLIGDDLKFDINFSADLVSAYDEMVKVVGHPEKTPPLELMGEPIWTTWARYKDKIDQETVLEFAQEIIDHGYPYQVMEIDDRWQSEYGDLDFDPQRFPDPKRMVDALHELGFKVTMWVIPFLHPRSKAAKEGSVRGYLVRDGKGDPYKIKWWQGAGYLLDVTSPEAMDWFGHRLKALQDEVGIDGYKFDGGEAKYVPEDAVFEQSIDSSNGYTHHYIDWVSKNYSFCEVRSGWNNQTSSLFFRLWDLSSNWTHANGLRSVIPSTLSLSLCGYPFNFPDMIGGNAYFEFPNNKIIHWLIVRVLIPILERNLRKGKDTPEDEVLGYTDVPKWIEKTPWFGYPTAELMVRWTQMNALMQIMQFSIPPWEFGEECSRICRQYAQLHLEFTPQLQAAAREAIETSAPVIRPVSWLAPQDEKALLCDDQFLVGEEILVAPVVEKAARMRDVYLPPGRWKDYWTSQLMQGPLVLEDYPAPLDILPIFIAESK
ncbi:MAG: glycoside hydrolase family 31 protein [Anaerolineales bacterium]|jgi:alpha-glucosidase (family GH31 glycosyl hydrolase)